METSKMSPGRKGIRGGTRIPVELPVQIRWKTQAGTERFAQGKTESMSGNGLFILVPVRLRHDTPIQFTVSLPAEVTNTPMQLHCEGRVVRQHKGQAPVGLGVVIDDYRLAAIKGSV
jgi:PilZ domain